MKRNERQNRSRSRRPDRKRQALPAAGPYMNEQVDCLLHVFIY